MISLLKLQKIKSQKHGCKWQQAQTKGNAHLQDSEPKMDGKQELTIMNTEVAANARGIATEVTLSYGPFKYVCF